MRFETIESTPESFARDAEDVLIGRHVLSICRGYLQANTAGLLTERFESHPDSRHRAGDAQGEYLGVFHWQKSPREYVEEVAKYSLAAARFSSDWNSIIAKLGRQLNQSNVITRPAIWNDVSASTPITRSWFRGSEFALIPHEDASQCKDPQQAGFEVQEIATSSRVCSLNLCIATDGGGDLVLWNYIPNDDDKLRYGTGTEGGPYPQLMVSHAEKLTVPIGIGDLYIFNGHYTHAVRATLGKRITISSLIGLLPTKECVLWS